MRNIPATEPTPNQRIQAESFGALQHDLDNALTHDALLQKIGRENAALARFIITMSNKLASESIGEKAAFYKGFLLGELINSRAETDRYFADWLHDQTPDTTVPH